MRLLLDLEGDDAILAAWAAPRLAAGRDDVEVCVLIERRPEDDRRCLDLVRLPPWEHTARMRLACPASSLVTDILTVAVRGGLGVQTSETEEER